MGTKQRKPRIYQPSWELLKKNKRLVLKVMPPFVSQVKRAIIKEKDMDIVFKVENEEDKHFLHIEHDLSTNRLTFTLKPQFGI